MPFDRRIVGSNPSLAASHVYRDLGQDLHLQLRVALWLVNFDSVDCCGSQRLLKAQAVRSAIEMDKYNTIYYLYLLFSIV